MLPPPCCHHHRTATTTAIPPPPYCRRHTSRSNAATAIPATLPLPPTQPCPQAATAAAVAAKAAAALLCCCPCYHGAATATKLLPLGFRRHQRLEAAAVAAKAAAVLLHCRFGRHCRRHCQASATLLPHWLRLQPATVLLLRCRTAPAAASALPLLPSCCRSASVALLPQPSCHRCRHHAATAAKLPAPLLHCYCPHHGRAAAKLPLPPPSCLPPLSCRCCRNNAVLPPTPLSCPPQPSCSCCCHAATLLLPPPSFLPPQSCPLLPGCCQAAGCEICGGMVVCGVWMCDISSAFFGGWQY